MISTRRTADPRLEALFSLDEISSPDVRPLVRPPGRGVPVWAFAAIAVLGGLLLFWMLESRRLQPVAPAVRPAAADTAAGSYEPPALYIPPAYPGQAPVLQVLPGTTQPSAVALIQSPRTAPVGPVMTARTISAPIAYTPPAPQVAPFPQPPVARQPRVSGGPILVADSTVGGNATAAPHRVEPTGLGSGTGNPLAGRVRAGAFANPSGTVPQGAMIAAVLETAFDSTKPGFARALVSRDVRGFDGRSVLIPRGSRLIGEYGAEVAPAQRRAAIIWNRLIRPDGVTIELQSPAVDTLGRTGIPASVNSHFLQRFTTALLRTTMDIGSAVASRASRTPVLIATPGTIQTQAAMPSGTITPTLRVPAGRSISIFVAQDLDFGSQERSR